MGSRKHILIVGFEKKNKLKYPHLKQTIEYLQNNYYCDYLYFPERGYFLNCDFSISLKRNIIKLYHFIKFFFSLIKIIYIKISNKYNTIIAIDNFTYVVCSIFFNNTILWSHDFVTIDQDQSNCAIQKLIAKLTRKFLFKNKKLIIQDSERLSLFLESNTIKSQIDLDIFYFPVSLLPVDENIQISKNCNLPILMQIGGINKFRSGSDALMNNYQSMHNKYNLILHGYFAEEIQKQLMECKHIPIVSSLELLPNDVYKIVTKCDIGFICYKTHNKNFHYIKYASGQLVEFLRCAKPVIIMGNTNLKNFIDEKKIGVSIDSIEDLVQAIKKISTDYLVYKKNAKACFESIYNINLYLNNLGVWIDD